MCHRTHYQRLPSPRRPIEQERPYRIWEAASAEGGSEGEDDVLGDELADEGHGGVVGTVISGIVKHRVQVVELANEVGQVVRRKLLHDVVLDQLNQQVLLLNVLHCLPPRVLQLLLLRLLCLLLLFLLLLDASQNPHVVKFNFDHLVNFLFVSFLHTRHHLFLRHRHIMPLFVVFRFVSVRPYLVVISIEIVELLHHFRDAELHNCLAIILIVSLLLLLLPSRLLRPILLFLLLFGLLFIRNSLGFFFLGRERRLQVESLVKGLQVLGRLVRVQSLVLLDPIPPLLHHVVDDVHAGVVVDFHFKVLLRVFILLHEGLSLQTTLLFSLLHPGDRVVLHLFKGPLLATHPQKHHFLLTQLLNTLPS
mmetsp:Transcript_21794/g.16135  ORF Transcript_21794/g.16135 Transcript_21794/m.16135 type:complete len:364 (-) Transcript_21794:657-1748(-)